MRYCLFVGYGSTQSYKKQTFIWNLQKQISKVKDESLIRENKPK